MSFEWRVLESFPDSALESAWRRFLSSADMPTHYTAPEFFREPPLGQARPLAVLALDTSTPDARVVGVLTGFRQGRRLTCGLSTRPQIAIDPAAGPDRVADCLAEGLLSAAAGFRKISVTTWSPLPAFQSALGTCRQHAGVVMHELDPDPEVFLKRLKGTRRRHILASLRGGLEVRQSSGPGDVETYYPVLRDWSHRKQLPVAPLEYYQRLFALDGNRRLFLAFHEGRLIAGSVVRFVPGGVAEYSANSSLLEARALKPNELLLWRILEWACREGLPRLCMGGSGQFHFKYGGTLQPVYEYQLDRTLLRLDARRDTVRKLVRSLVAALPDPVVRRMRHVMKRPPAQAAPASED